MACCACNMAGQILRIGIQFAAPMFRRVAHKQTELSLEAPLRKRKPSTVKPPAYGSEASKPRAAKLGKPRRQVMDEPQGEAAELQAGPVSRGASKVEGFRVRKFWV